MSVGEEQLMLMRRGERNSDGTGREGSEGGIKRGLPALPSVYHKLKIGKWAKQREGEQGTAVLRCVLI